MDKFIDTHYFSLPYQGNLYTMVNLEMVDSPNKLLVAHLKREIFYIEFQPSPHGYIPTSKEVSFTYIPSGAEIISMDAFNKSSTKNEFVIGVTIIKKNSNFDAWEFYLNIYSEWEESDYFNIENVAQNCLNVQLNFTPYQLIHTDLIIWEGNEIVSKEVVFLLSGSDDHIHVYREQPTEHIYKEMENKELYFPELDKTLGPVVYMDVYHNDDLTERIIGVGCEKGFIRVTGVNLKTNKLLFNYYAKLDVYISCVKFFTEYDKPKIRDGLLEKIGCKKTYSKDQPLNFIVINTILRPLVFEDVLTYGLSKVVGLPRRDTTSVLSFCQVADIDFDGQKEILIGSNAEELLLYKNIEAKGWCLQEVKLFGSPILSMKYIDVIGDGTKTLVVMGTKGINFLQHNFEYVQKVIDEKINKLSIEDEQ